MHVGNPLNFAWSEICIFKIRGKYPLDYSLHPSDNTIFYSWYVRRNASSGGISDCAAPNQILFRKPHVFPSVWH
jgi:hypothetical protein